MLSWQGSQARFVSCASVLAWQEHWPHVVPLPHPSPRNQAWFKRTPWFESELIPKLRRRVRGLLRD